MSGQRATPPGRAPAVEPEPALFDNAARRLPRPGERIVPRMNDGQPGVDAVVLASSSNHIPLYPGHQPGPKALVELAGQPLIATVLDALQECPGVARVLVVGEPPVLEYAARWRGVTGARGGASLADNAVLGLELSRTERVLFCNPDQPLLRVPMVSEFLRRAPSVDADLVMSWVAPGPGSVPADLVHKFVRFGDGTYAHGNLFLVRRALAGSPELLARINALYAARKSNLRFARVLGPVLLLRYLASRLEPRPPRLQKMLDLVGARLGIRIGYVLGSHPEIAFDIDEPEDYRAAAELLAAREWGGEPCPVTAGARGASLAQEDRHNKIPSGATR